MARMTLVVQTLLQHPSTAGTVSANKPYGWHHSESRAKTGKHRYAYVPALSYSWGQREKRGVLELERTSASAATGVAVCGIPMPVLPSIRGATASRLHTHERGVCLRRGAPSRRRQRRWRARLRRPQRSRCSGQSSRAARRAARHPPGCRHERESVPWNGLGWWYRAAITGLEWLSTCPQ